MEMVGLAVYARGDLLSIETAFGGAEICLPLLDVLSIEAHPAGAGRSVPHEAESFVARLSLLQLATETVEVVTRGAAWRGEGSVRTIGRDHLTLVTSRGSVHIPIESICGSDPEQLEVCRTDNGFMVV